jgi:F420-non-reducing hydrogenase iron-sulfur subunit
MTAHNEHAPAAPAKAAEPVPTTIIGIVCERSVDFTDQLNTRECLSALPHVRVIKVPCSGHIQPVMLETALKHGARGVFAMGCRMGDCHYREGNKFLRERLMGTRMPKLKPSVDKRRVQAYWLSALEYEKFESMVRAFDVSLDELEKTATPA